MIENLYVAASPKLLIFLIISARATSATPLYFEPYYDWINSSNCLDGGLRDNNPSDLALDETYKIWNDKVKVDLLLSLGSGIGKKSTTEPAGVGNLPASIRNLFKVLMATLNGQSAWERSCESIQQRTRCRAIRLNPQFPWETEPALDATNEIEKMATCARNYEFHHQSNISPFAAEIAPTPDALLQTALQLRASLYYFHLESITRDMDQEAIVVKGQIRCRIIRPDQESAFQHLLVLTRSFYANNSEVTFNKRVEANEVFKVPIVITSQLKNESLPIRIDAAFQTKASDRKVAISGFPLSLEVRGPNFLKLE